MPDSKFRLAHVAFVAMLMGLASMAQAQTSDVFGLDFDGQVGEYQLGSGLVDIPVKLLGEPTGDVVVDSAFVPEITVAPGVVVTVDVRPDSLTFTQENWDASGSEAQKFTFSASTGAAIDVSDLDRLIFDLVINEDYTDDERYFTLTTQEVFADLVKPGFIVTAPVDAQEGGHEEFVVELVGSPGGRDVTITVNAHPQLTYVPAERDLRFTAGMELVRTISILFNDDFDTGDDDVEIDLTFTEAHSSFATMFAQEFINDDEAGLAIGGGGTDLGNVPLDGAERGFLLRLSTQPTVGNVVVTIDHEGMFSTSQGDFIVGIDPVELTFNQGNWDAGIPVGIFADYVGGATGFNRLYTFTVGVKEVDTADSQFHDEAVVDGSQIDHTFVLQANLRQQAPQDIEFTRAGGDVDEGQWHEVRVSLVGEARMVTTRVRFGVPQIPTDTEVIYNPLDSRILTFPPGPTPTPAQVISISKVDNQVDEGDSVQLRVTLHEDGTSIFRFVDLSFNDDDTANLVVNGGDHAGLGDLPLGDQLRVPVRLATQPLEGKNVIVTLDYVRDHTIGEESIQVVVTPDPTPALTFDRNNWDEDQYFVFSAPALSDTSQDRSMPFVFDVGVNEVNPNTDPIYAELNDVDISSNLVLDPLWVVEQATTPLTEGVGWLEIDVMLTGRDREERSVVTLGVGNDRSQFEFNPTSGELPFEVGETAKKISILLKGDEIDQGVGREIVITVGETQTGLVEEFTRTWADDDEAGFVVNNDEDLDPIQLNGGPIEIPVVLTSEPTGDVVVRISGEETVTEGGDQLNVAFTTQELTFDKNDWDEPKPFIIEASTDRTQAVNRLYDLEVGVKSDGTTDTSGYESLEAKPLETSLVQDEQPGVNFTYNQRGGIPEGTRITVSVQLTLGARSVSPIFTVGINGDRELFEFDPPEGELEIDKDDRDHNDFVIRYLGDDVVQDSARSFTFTIGEKDSTRMTMFTQAWADDDEVGLVIEGAEEDGNLGDVRIGTSRTFWVSLMSEPTGDVVVTVVLPSDTASLNPGGGEAAVAFTPQVRTFNASNWDTPQSFTMLPTTDETEEKSGNYSFGMGVNVDDTTDGSGYKTIMPSDYVLLAALSQTGQPDIGVTRDETDLVEGDWMEVTVRLTGPTRDDGAMVTVGAGDADNFNPSSKRVTFQGDSIAETQVISVQLLADAEFRDGGRDVRVTIGEVDGEMTVFTQTWTDDTTPGLIVNGGSHDLGFLPLENEETRIRVALKSEPTGPVFVTLGYGGRIENNDYVVAAALTPSSGEIQLDVGNWQSGEEFVVQLELDQASATVDEDYPITIGVDTSNSAAEYASVGETELVARLENNLPAPEEPGLEVTYGMDSSTLTEGDELRVTAKLTGDDRDVDAVITLGLGMGGVPVDRDLFTFTPPDGTKPIPQDSKAEFVITIVLNDDMIDQGQDWVIDLTVGETDDRTDVTVVTWINDDMAGLMFHPEDVSLDGEGNMVLGNLPDGVPAGIRVRLQSEPTGPVAVTVGGAPTAGASDEFSLAFSNTHTFDTSSGGTNSWDVFHEFTVTPMTDSSAELEVEYTVYVGVDPNDAADEYVGFVDFDLDASLTNEADVELGIGAIQRNNPGDDPVQEGDSTNLDVFLTGGPRDTDTEIQVLIDTVDFSVSPASRTIPSNTPASDGSDPSARETFSITYEYTPRNEDEGSRGTGLFSVPVTVSVVGTEETIIYDMEFMDGDAARLVVNNVFVSSDANQIRTSVILGETSQQIPVRLDSNPRGNVVVTIGYEDEITIGDDVVVVRVEPNDLTFEPADFTPGAQNFVLMASTTNPALDVMQVYTVTIGVRSEGTMDDHYTSFTNRRVSMTLWQVPPPDFTYETNSVGPLDEGEWLVVEVNLSGPRDSAVVITMGSESDDFLKYHDDIQQISFAIGETGPLMLSVQTTDDMIDKGDDLEVEFTIGEMVADNDKTFTRTFTEDDVAGLVVGEAPDDFELADGLTIPVRLATQPQGQVLVDVTHDMMVQINGGPLVVDVGVNSSQLMFTESNWDRDQDVTFTPTTGESWDTSLEVSETFSFSFAINTATEDSEYSTNVPEVSRETLLKQTPPYDFSYKPWPNPVTEGAVGRISVWLNESRSTPTVITIGVPDGFTLLDTRQRTFLANTDSETTMFFRMIPTNNNVDEAPLGQNDYNIDVTLGESSGPNVDRHIFQLQVRDNDTAGLNVFGGVQEVTQSVIIGTELEIPVYLVTDPTLDVVVTIGFADTSSGTDVIEVSFAEDELTFNPGEYGSANAKSFVMETEIQNANLGVEQTYTVTVGIKDADTMDDVYDMVSESKLSMTLWQDPPARGIMVTPSTTEDVDEDVTVTYVIRSTGPPRDMDINFGAEVSMKGLVFDPDPSGGPLTIPEGTEGIVSVSFNDDIDNAEMELEFIITIGEVGEPVDSVVSHTQTWLDLDEAGIGFDITGMDLGNVEGSKTFMVTLASEPLGDVVVTIGSSADADPFVVSFSDELTFTPDAWDQPKPFTVTPTTDSAGPLSVPYTFQVGADPGRSDDQYDTFADIPLSAMLVKSEQARLILDRTTVAIDEGEWAAVTIMLRSPDRSETTTITVGAGDADDFLPPSQEVVFPIDYLDTDVLTISILKEANDVDEGPFPRIDVTLGVKGTDVTAVFRQAFNNDDVAGLVVNGGLELDLGEFPLGEESTFAVRLGSKPRDDVLVTIGAASNVLVDTNVVDVMVAPLLLTFTSDNWDTDQDVTLMPSGDPSVAVSQDYNITVGVNPLGTYDEIYDVVAPVTLDAGLEQMARVVPMEIGYERSTEDPLPEGDWLEVLVSITGPDRDDTATITFDTDIEVEYFRGVDEVEFEVGDTGAQAISIRLPDDNVDQGAQRSVNVMVGEKDITRMVDFDHVWTDDDTAGLVANNGEADLGMVSVGEDIKVAVYLTSEPTGAVVVTVGHAESVDYEGNLVEFTATPLVLNFTPDDWDLEQQFSVSSSTDSLYAAINITDLQITVAIKNEDTQDVSYHNVGDEELQVDVQQAESTPPNPHIRVTHRKSDSTVAVSSGDVVEHRNIGNNSGRATLGIRGTQSGNFWLEYSAISDESSADIRINFSDSLDGNGFIVRGNATTRVDVRYNDNVNNARTTYTLVFTPRDTNPDPYGNPEHTFTVVMVATTGAVVEPEPEDFGYKIDFSGRINEGDWLPIAVSLTGQARGDEATITISSRSAERTNPHSGEIVFPDQDTGERTLSILVGDEVDQQPDNYDFAITLSEKGTDRTTIIMQSATDDDDGPADLVIPGGMDLQGSRDRDFGTLILGDDLVFPVVLNSEPASDVVVTIKHSPSRSSGGGNVEFSADPEKVTFTPGNWDTVRTVTMTATENQAAQDSDARVAINLFEVSVSVLSGETDDDVYSGLEEKLRFAVQEQDFGLSYDPVALPEDGDWYPIKVSLTGPARDVTVTITVGTQIGVIDETDPKSGFLTITGNDDMEHTLSILIDNKVVDQGPYYFPIVTIGELGTGKEKTIQLNVQDANTNELLITGGDNLGVVDVGVDLEISVRLGTRPEGDVVVTLGHDGVRDVTGGMVRFTSSPDDLMFTSEDFDDAKTFVLSSTPDEGLGEFVIESFVLTVGTDDTGTGDTTYRGVGDKKPVVSFSTPNDIAVRPVEGDYTEGDWIAITVDLTGTPRGSDARIRVRAGPRAKYDPSSGMLNITDGTMTGHVISVKFDDDIHQPNGMSYVVTVSEVGTDNAVEFVQFVANDDMSGLAIVNGTDLGVLDVGDELVVRMSLTSEPRGPVAVTIGAAEEVDVEGKQVRVNLSEQTLTFTPDDWDDEKSFTISPSTDDASLDVNIDDFEITVGIADDDTNDYLYEEVGETHLSVALLQIQRGIDIALTPASGDLVEGMTLTVEITPSAFVRGEDGTDITVGFGPASADLMFDPPDGMINIPDNQTRTISIWFDDDIANADSTFQITIGEDIELMEQEESITQKWTNNDTAGLGFVDSEGTEIAGTDLGEVFVGETPLSFGVTLTSEPTGNVVVTINGNDTEGEFDVVFFPTSKELLFTPSNYTEPKQFTIIPTTESGLNMEQAYQVMVGVDATDPLHAADEYDDVEVTLSALLVNSGTPGINVTRDPDLAFNPEGETVEFEISLTGPDRDVSGADGAMITYGADMDLPGLDIVPAGTQILVPNGMARTISVTYDDDFANKDTDLVITFSEVVESGEDPIVASFAQTWENSEIVGLSIIDEDDLNLGDVRVGTQRPFEVVLDSEPMGDVVVFINGGASDSSGAVVVGFDPLEHTFDGGNWDVPFEFTMETTDNIPGQGVDESYSFVVGVRTSGTEDSDYAGEAAGLSAQLQKNGLDVVRDPDSDTRMEGMTVAFEVTPTGPDRTARIMFSAGDNPPAGLVFDPPLGDSPISIETSETRTISASYDDDIDKVGDTMFDISFSEVDGDYSIEFDDETWTDDDTANVVANGGTALGPLVVGSDLEFAVTLNSAPTSGKVRVTIGGDTAPSGFDVQFDPPHVDFTSANWDDPMHGAFTVTPSSTDPNAGIDVEYTVVVGVAMDETEATEYHSFVSSPTELDTRLQKHGFDVTRNQAASVAEGVTVEIEVTPTGPARGGTGARITLGVGSDRDIFSLNPSNGEIMAEVGETRTISIAFDNDYDDDGLMDHQITVGEHGRTHTEVFTQTWTDNEDFGFVVNVVGDGNHLGTVRIDAVTPTTFEVALNSRPTGNVAITVGGAMADSSGAFGVSFLPASNTHVFMDTDDWDTPAVFTVVPADNDPAQGVDERYEITVGVDPGRTTDTDFAGLASDTRLLIARLQKNGFDVTRVRGTDNVAEGVTVAFEVTPTGPDRDTMFTYTAENLDGLVFDPSGGQIPVPEGMTRTISVSFDDDYENVDETRMIDITFSEVGETHEETIRQTWTDEDTAGLGFSLLDGNLGPLLLGTEQTFMVSLTSKPTGDVVVWAHTSDVEVEDGHVVTVSVSAVDVELEFTTLNWNVGQPVTVSASTGDTAVVVDHEYVVRLSVDTGGATQDDIYEGLAVSVLTGRLDQAGMKRIEVTPFPSDTETEGMTIELRVTPTGQARTGDIMVTLNVGADRDGLIIDPPEKEITIPMGMMGAFSLSFDDDFDNDGLELQITVGEEVGASEDPIEVPLTLTWENEATETAGLSVVDGANMALDTLGVVNVGTDRDFYVVLDSRPTGNVVVTVGGDEGATMDTSGAFGVGFTQSAHTFNGDNWDEPFMFTLEPSDLIEAQGVEEDFTVIVGVRATGTEDTDYARLVDSQTELVAQLQKDGITVTRLTDMSSVMEGTPISYEVSLTGPDRTGGSAMVTYRADRTMEGLVFNPTGEAVMVSNGEARTISVTYDDDIANVDDTVFALTFGEDGKDYSIVFADQAWENEDMAGLEINTDDVTGTSLGDLPVDNGKMIRVRLTSEPTDAVVVTVGGTTPVGVFTVEFPQPHTFTDSNWDTYHPFTVTPSSSDNSEPMESDGYEVIVGVDATQTRDSVYDQLATTPTELIARLVQFGPQGLSLSLSTQEALTEGVVLVVGVSLTGPARTSPPSRITVGSGTTDLMFNPGPDGEVMLSTGEARTISIWVDDDMVAQGDRTFVITVGEDGLTRETFTQIWEDDDTAGFANTHGTSDLPTVRVGGSVLSIPVTLSSQPTGDVVITVGGATAVTLDDGVFNVTFTPQTHTFTSGNWDMAQDFDLSFTTSDGLLGVDQTYTITMGVETGATTEDDTYRALGSMELRTTVLKEGLGVGRRDGDVVEGDWVEVTVSLTGLDRGALTRVTVGSGAGVVFNPSSGEVSIPDGNTSEFRISVQVADDDIDQGMHREFMVTIGEAGATPTRMTVFGQTWTNNDMAGLLVNGGAVLGAVEVGTTVMFDVVLTSEPTHNVPVTIGGATAVNVDGGVVNVALSPSSRTFTSSNWDSPQAFTLVAMSSAETLSVGENYDVFVGIGTTSDGRYSDPDVVGVARLAAQLEQSPPADLVYFRGEAAVAERTGWAVVTVSLAGPSRNRQTTVSASANDGVGITFLPSSGEVTFPSNHDGMRRTISISYDDSIDQDDTVDIAVTLIEVGAVEPVRATKTFTQTFNDEDTSDIVVNGDETDLGTLQLGVSRTFAVNLETQPSGEVVITVGHTENEDRGDELVNVSVEPLTLTFTEGNWAEEQSVAVLLTSATTMTFTVPDYAITVGVHNDASQTGDAKYRSVSVVVLDADLQVSPSDFVLTGLPMTLTEGSWATVAVSLTGQSRGKRTTIEFSSGDTRFMFNPDDGQVEFRDGSTDTFTVSVWFEDNIETPDTFGAALTVRELGTARMQPYSLAVSNNEMATLSVGRGANLTLVRVGREQSIPVGINTEPTDDVVVTVDYMREVEATYEDAAQTMTITQTIAVSITPATLRFTADDWQSEQTFAITISTASTLSLTVSSYEIEFSVMPGGAEEYLDQMFTLTTQLRSAGLFTEEDVAPTAAAVAVVDLGAAQFALDAIGGNFIGGGPSAGGQQPLGPSLDLGGVPSSDDDDLDDPWAQGDGWRDDFVTLLDGGTFRLPLGGDGGTGSLEVWGEGRLIDVSGNRDPESGSYTYDGRATGFVLGIGRRGDNVGYGLAVARTSSKVDIDSESLSVERIENDVLTLLPYAGVSFGSGSRVWVVGGYGEGKAELLLSGQEEKTDSSVRSLGLGFEHAKDFGGYELAGRLLASGSRSTLEGTEEVPELANVKGTAHRLRAEFEAERGIDMFGMGNGTVFGVAALRRDGGDAGSSTGLEVGGGVRGRMMDGYSLEMEGRLQANSSEHEEHSVRLRVGYDAGYDGRGLSLGADGEGAAGADYGWGRTVLGHHGVLSVGIGRDGHGEDPTPRLGFKSSGLRMSVAGDTSGLEASFDLVVVGR